MFFTRLGAIAAWLALIMAAGRIGVALYITMGIQDAEQAAFWSARYLGSKSPAATIDHAAVVAAFAIALGILVEISRAIRRAN